MKNSSSRFMCEFDTVDTVAMRNVSEKRKLQEYLGSLEKELHRNLVRMETEMSSIRLEKSEADIVKRKMKPKDSKTGTTSSVEGKSEKGMQQMVKQVMKKKSEAGVSPKSQNLPWSLRPLPKITTTSFPTVEQEKTFDYEKEYQTDTEMSLGRTSSLETISEFGQKHLVAEKRILTSLHHPRALSKVHPRSRPPTPQTQTPTFLTTTRADSNERRSSWDSRNERHGLLVPLPDEYVSKSGLYRVHSAPDLADIVAVSEHEPFGKDVHSNKGKPEKPSTKEVEADSRTENDSQENNLQTPGRRLANSLKESSAPKSKLGKRASDFHDADRPRLQVSNGDIPDKEEMKKIRYLRYKDETANTEDGNILSVFDKKL